MAAAGAPFSKPKSLKYYYFQTSETTKEEEDEIYKQCFLKEDLMESELKAKSQLTPPNTKKVQRKNTKRNSSPGDPETEPSTKVNNLFLELIKDSKVATAHPPSTVADTPAELEQKCDKLEMEIGSRLTNPIKITPSVLVEGLHPTLYADSMFPKFLVQSPSPSPPVPSPLPSCPPQPKKKVYKELLRSARRIVQVEEEIFDQVVANIDVVSKDFTAIEIQRNGKSREIICIKEGEDILIPCSTPNCKDFNCNGKQHHNRNGLQTKILGKRKGPNVKILKANEDDDTGVPKIQSVCSLSTTSAL